MSRDSEQVRDSRSSERESNWRYEKPMILSRESLEAMAVACNPPQGKEQGLCVNPSS